MKTLHVYSYSVVCVAHGPWVTAFFLRGTSIYVYIDRSQKGTSTCSRPRRKCQSTIVPGSKIHHMELVESGN